ncbi:unnamed protein product (macronuclear) [Paramecium tetraurelia]|uniref:B box-type domain-containing protein n=1 Tax=Paramecium tetraurelia TaxID=5888 RepID=A0CAW0_PARTE|nr:uncharacterized protein GSPATT00036708001 [Paramecium tetraurelia]CAK67927.1 unnamed protein product [Paramecium tetraurelia]|eukprot:XP_001435324.1 hypothetical protein (macronuclear) [Paramecium tetraurelia strain d4-2]
MLKNPKFKESLTSRSQQQECCKLQGHENNLIQFVCACHECPYRYQKACAHCVIKLHGKHVEDMKEIEEFDTIINENSKKAKSLIKQSDELFLQLKNPFGNFFEQLKQQLIEMIDSVQKRYLLQNQERAQQLIRNELDFINQFNQNVNSKQNRYLNDHSLKQYSNSLRTAQEKLIIGIQFDIVARGFWQEYRSQLYKQHQSKYELETQQLPQYNDSQICIELQSDLKKLEIDQFMSKQSKQYLSTSAPHVDTSQLSGVSPKKEFYDATKQLEAARRRISLLRLENEMRYGLDILSEGEEIANPTIKARTIEQDQGRSRTVQGIQIGSQRVSERAIAESSAQNKEYEDAAISRQKTDPTELSIDESNLKEMSTSFDRTWIQQNNKRQNKNNKFRLKSNLLNKLFKTSANRSTSDSFRNIKSPNLSTLWKQKLKKQEAYLLIKLDETTNQVNKLNQSALIKQSQTTPQTASYS